MRKKDKEKVLALVKERVCYDIIQDAEIEDEATKRDVESILGETIFLELARLDREKKTSSRLREHKKLIQRRKRLFKIDAREQREMLADFVDEFASEVIGNFNENVYLLATKVLPLGLSTLLNAMSPRQFLKSLPAGLPKLDQRIICNGAVAHVQKLNKIGTLIYAPTHLSNLDSIIIGYGLYRCDLPPATYGAGINLFSNPMMSYFMNNLGAYKVDRKKKNSLYKRVLKEYATITMELGYPNLFFPGGTRSRSGEVEKKLKLGLLGCGLTAYINNLKTNKPKPKNYIVPLNLSYQLTLEAENLVNDALKESGKSRSIITDDEFAKPKRVLDFVQNIFDLDARIYMTMGEPIDCFGNFVNERGESIDKAGRVIDIRRYVINRDGEPLNDPQRDQEYTRLLGDILLAAYHRHNTIMSTQLLARVVFDLMRERHTGDLYRFLREARLDDEGLEFAEVEVRLSDYYGLLSKLADRGEVRLDERLVSLSPHGRVMNGLKHLAIYHTNPVLEKRGDKIFVTDAKLLYYYRNRVKNYELN